MIHRKKNRPSLQRRDILTVFLIFYFFIYFFIGNLPSSSFVVLFFIAFYTAEFSSKHFILGISVRCLFTQLFFLLVLLLLLLSMTAFTYVGLLSLF